MNRKFLTTFFLAATIFIVAQQVDTEKQNWFHQDYSKTGIFGVGTNEAIKFLEDKKVKPNTITVAVIDSGIEIDHEDLKYNIWVNKKEIKGNGKDDDKNGYIDDVNGWDFIGGKNGEDVDIDTYEMLRMVVQGKKLFDGNTSNQTKMPEKYSEYLAAKKELEEKIDEHNKNLELYRNLQYMYPMIMSEIKKYTGNNKLTPEYLKTLDVNANLKQIVDGMIESGETADYTADEYLEFVKKELEDGVKHFQEGLQFQLNEEYDPRKIVGDNYENKREKYYGNNEVEGPDASHGTHVAGIIAAKRNNKIGIDGIAGNVAKIMAIRAVPNGDERDKDIANAIRYAADNGAKIINMSFGKDYSPDKEIVWEAIKYADDKGVLMFHAAGNDNKDVDVEPNFPTNYKNGTSFTKNWITVGASTRKADDLRADFSNFGKIKVDIFAPGYDIYSTYTDQKYKYESGTSMASPTAAGCAALLWAYFPTLTATQVKEILLSTVNKSNVVVGVGEQDEKTQEYKIKKSFSDLSVTGGVIDVNKAIQKAYELTAKKISKPKKSSKKRK